MLVLLLVSGPGHAQHSSDPYLRLQTALDLYLQIAENGGWPTVPAGPTLAPGDAGPRVAALARRLVVTGDLNDHRGDPGIYDDALKGAVLHFQARHGLETDALVGRATLRALNVPVDARIRQLRLNLDRTRRVLENVRDDYVVVNVPAFEAVLYRDGTPAWATRVIVGETEAETPLFQTAIHSVVLNPTWTVPYSIASKELLPKIRRDPAFLTRGGYDVFRSDGSPVDPVTIDWGALSSNNFPYTLVQRPGPVNELGRVKFIIPNEHGVCMHDTPKKQLFLFDSRAFSHGCIRMDKPVDFAVELLRDEGWTRQDVDNQLASRATKTIPLGRLVPVVVAYLTAAVDETGTVHFYRDVYGWDAG